DSLFEKVYTSPEKYKYNLPLYLVLTMNFWVVLFSCLLSIYQLYLLRLFSKRSVAAYRAVDSAGFNETLILLNWSNRASLLGIFVFIAYSLLRLTTYLNAITRLSHLPN
ncbi:MAG TPA: hypothetical protein VNW04_16635, partial [Puia sp.]|nr:hypothetical protein [Puia sp.]